MTVMNSLQFLEAVGREPPAATYSAGAHCQTISGHRWPADCQPAALGDLVILAVCFLSTRYELFQRRSQRLQVQNGLLRAEFLQQKAESIMFAARTEGTTCCIRIAAGAA